MASDAHLEKAPRLDSDTTGVPGSPDIGAKILDKIEKSLIFVADVSIANQGNGGRAVPNPNVMFELGFAFKALGESRIAMVMNTAFGLPEDLPFDLRAKRVQTYHSLPEESTRAEIRKNLAKKIQREIENILASFTGANVKGDVIREIDLLAERFSAGWAVAKKVQFGPVGEATSLAVKTSEALTDVRPRLANIPAGDSGLAILDNVLTRLKDLANFKPQFNLSELWYAGERVISLLQRIGPALREPSAVGTHTTSELHQFYQEVNITSNRHLYRLVTRLTNFGHSDVRKWHIDLEVPTLLLESSPRFFKEVSGRASPGYRFFRADQSTHGDGGAIHPGDWRDISLEYVITSQMQSAEMIGQNKLFDLPVRATAYVDDKLADKISRKVRDLQHF